MKDAISLRGHVIYVIKKNQKILPFMKYLFSVSTSCSEYVSQGHTSIGIKNIQDISYKKSECNNNIMPSLTKYMNNVVIISEKVLGRKIHLIIFEPETNLPLNP